MRRTLMKLNTTFFISILLLIILAIGAVSASEDISDVAIAAEPSDDIISDQIDDNLEETGPQNEILVEETEVKNLTELKDTLEHTEGDIVLENDYKYSPGDIHLAASVYNTCVIDGKGHTIDGDGNGFAISIHANDVIVKNLIFKNIVDTYETGTRGYSLFYLDGTGIRIENCTFENITHNDEYGPIIRFKANDSIVSNCTFKDVDAVALIEFEAGDAKINDCNFINSNASRFIFTSGYAYDNIQINNCNFEGNNGTWTFISINGDDSQINNCTFKDNIGGYNTYLTRQWGNNVIMHNCTFENNFAIDSDDADRFPIAVFGYQTGGPYENISVTNTTFKNNRGIPIRWYADSGNVTGCVFEGNNGTIDNHGTVYRDNGIYDFEVIVYNDTVIGGSSSPYGPIDSEDDLFVEFINYGPKEGNIVISLNGTECYNKPNTETNTSIYLDDLDPVKAGQLNVVVKYVFADGEYILYNDTTFINYTLAVVNAYVLYFNPIYPHGEVTLNITLPKDATGTLIFSDENGNHTIEYADGQANYTLKGSDYDNGVHSFYISLVNDPNYPEQSSAYQFNIQPKVDYPFIVAEGETAFILLDCPDDFEGNIALYNMTEDEEKGELILNESIKGISKVQLPALTEGYNFFIIEITDRDGPIRIECIKNDAGINSSIDSNIIIVGDDAVINVDCQLSNCTLLILVDENRPTEQPEQFELNDTSFVHKISNLALGEHVIKLIVMQTIEEETPFGPYINESYVYSNTFLVNVIDPKLEVINSTIDKDSGVFQLKLSTSDGKAINGTRIALDVNGKEYLAITDDNGIANFVLSDLDVGNYTAHISLDGGLSALSQDVNIEVVSPDPIIKDRIETQIVCKNMTTTAVDVDTDGRVGQYFYITLKDKKGNLLKNKPVKIGFNAVVYDRVTDKNGQAKLQINLRNAGTYTFAVSFLGDDDYNGSFVVAKIVVQKQKGSLTVPAKTYKASATKTLTATFKSASGKVVSGKKITFTVNGKSYSATTNSKGVATVKVSLNKKGTYSFTAKFAGNSMYAAISKTAKLTIK